MVAKKSKRKPAVILQTLVPDEETRVLYQALTILWVLPRPRLIRVLGYLADRLLDAKLVAK